MASVAPYRDRREAGRLLGSLLVEYAGRSDVVVLALPRGGVPVAFEVARRIRAPLDVFVVRKLGIPGSEEYAMGAIASGGAWFLDREVIENLQIDVASILAVEAREQRELVRRERTYRGARATLDVGGKIVILVDDGLATGASMRAAIAGLAQLHPARIVAAVPVAAPSTCAELSSLVDEMICARTPRSFESVGAWYVDFADTSDDEVRKLLGDDAEFVPMRG